MGEGSIPPGGFHLPGGQKLEERGVSRRRRRREKSLSTSFEIFGKFVNKIAKKWDFGMVLVEISRKFRKKCPFFRRFRDISTKSPQNTSTKVPGPLPKYNPEQYLRYENGITADRRVLDHF